MKADDAIRELCHRRCQSLSRLVTRRSGSPSAPVISSTTRRSSPRHSSLVAPVIFHGPPGRSGGRGPSDHSQFARNSRPMTIGPAPLRLAESCHRREWWTAPAAGFTQATLFTRVARLIRPGATRFPDSPHRAHSLRLSATRAAAASVGLLSTARPRVPRSLIDPEAPRCDTAVHLDLPTDPYHRIGHEKTVRGFQTQ
jgi:hypothetical protein